jgi:hypothetical protein
MADEQRKVEQRKEANSFIATGVGVAAIGAVSAVIGGAICPMCVVAAPALLGVGAVQRIRLALAERKERVERAGATADEGEGEGADSAGLVDTPR